MLFNFRFDQQSTATVLTRLRDEHQMSQGWGGGEVNLDLTRPDFVQACLERYRSDGMNSTRIPSNLLRIRSFKDGDLLATPHLPERGKVAVHVVDGDFPACYRHQPEDPGSRHLNHRIRVKRSYGLDGNVSIYNTVLSAWYAKLQWLRLPVLPIPEHDDAFQSVIRQLDESPEMIFAVSPLEDHLASLLERVLDSLKSDLRRTLNPNNSDLSFETLCERLLVKSGYTVVGRNVFDGEGGDVDIHCTRKRGAASPFEAGTVTLFVQVKKHEGITDEIAVSQLVKMMAKDVTADGCVMSLAEDFSPKAKELAKQNDILLMNGAAVCTLALRSMLGE
jgi:hypothetical protein